MKEIITITPAVPLNVDPARKYYRFKCEKDFFDSISVGSKIDDIASGDTILANCAIHSKKTVRNEETIFLTKDGVKRTGDAAYYVLVSGRIEKR